MKYIAIIILSILAIIETAIRMVLILAFCIGTLFIGPLTYDISGYFDSKIWKIVEKISESL